MIADRWTRGQIERAAKISNDIAEDIDCGESRAALRRAVAIYADLFYDAKCELTAVKTDAFLSDMEVKIENLRLREKLLLKLKRKRTKWRKRTRRS